MNTNSERYKIYVASSWRNPYQQAVVSLLRDMEYDVYDFRNPKENDFGFAWSDIDEDWQQWTPDAYVKAMSHPIAESGFKSDFDAMKWADCCVMVLPCGRSANTEAGWMKGSSKPVYVFQPVQQEPELMYKIYDGILTSFEQLEDKFKNNQWQQSQPVSDKDIELLEEIRQIKAVIIHFATLDKMPTLQLLDREHLIAHVVTIAQKILRDFPPKSIKDKNRTGKFTIEEKLLYNAPGHFYSVAIPINIQEQPHPSKELSELNNAFDRLAAHFEENQSQEQQPVSDKDIEIVDKLSNQYEALKNFATGFFYYWWNQKGNNTAEGFQRWIETKDGSDCLRELLKHLDRKAALNKQGSDAVEFGIWLNGKDYQSTPHFNKMRSVRQNEGKPVEISELYKLFKTKTVQSQQ